MAAPHREVWSMSEVTYWSGQTDPDPAPAGGRTALEEARSHFFAGDYDSGDRLAKQYLQPKNKISVRTWDYARLLLILPRMRMLNQAVCFGGSWN